MLKFKSSIMLSSTISIYCTKKSPGTSAPAPSGILSPKFSAEL